MAGTRAPLSTHRAAKAIVALGLLAASAVVAGEHAGATEQDRITASEGQTIVREFPPIPASNPAAPEIGATTPDDCRAFEVSCDVVPITIEAPADEGAEYYVRISVMWEAEPDPSGLTSAASNDLDLYFWNDPPADMTATSTPDDPNTEEDEEEESNPAASGARPENLNWFSTEPGDFLLVINNYLGQNSGYTVTVRYFPTDAAPPGGFAGVTDPTPVSQPSPTATPPPSPPPAVDSGAFTAPPAAETTELALAPLEADPDFADFGAVDLESELASPPDIAMTTRQSRNIVEAPDPSTFSLLLWLLLVPVALLAGVGTWFARRRPAVLRMS